MAGIYFYQDGEGYTHLDMTTSGVSSAAGSSASTTDGTTIPHGMSQAPTGVIAIGSVAGEIVSVTALSATTFTVAIKKRSDGSAGTSQTIYWQAWF